MRVRHPYGEYLPDQSGLTDGLRVADGVFATPAGYRPVPSPAAIVNGTLPARCLGATSYRVNGVVHLLAGTATNLYRYTTSGFSSLASGLSASTDYGWRFAEAGGLMLATNGADPIKKYNPATGTIANLAGSPPTARYIGVVRDRVVLGYASALERKIAWSGAGLPESWTPAVGGPGSYEMASGGEITGLVGGEVGLVFQETRITRLVPSYDGSTWQYDELSPNIGCVAPWSIAQYGRLTFFLSARGWMVTDGASQPVAIGDEKIDRTFKALADRSAYPAMSVVVDPKNGLLMIAAPNATPSTKLFLYHIEAGRWTTAPVTTERLFAGLSQSVTLEGLDGTYPSIDDMETSLDDRIFQGGYPEAFLFDGSHRLCAMTGANLAATFTDAEREMIPGRRSRIRRARFLSDAGSGVTLTLATRNVLGETLAETEYTTLNRAGEFPIRLNTRFAQATFEIAAGTDWTFAQGWDVEFEDGGR